jgi:hypothetical protein
MNRISSSMLALLVAGSSSFAVVGCDEGEDGMVGGKVSPKAGSTVHVEFRRDYLGVNSVANTPMIGAMGEGATQPVGTTGTLKRMTDEFLVLQVPGDDKRELWIPRSAILLLDVTRKAE